MNHIFNKTAFNGFTIKIIFGGKNKSQKLTEDSLTNIT